MKTIIIEKGINQIKKYHLEDNFKNESELIKWMSSLSKKEMDNLINLDIDPEKITFPKEILLNKDLLKCKDYPEKIKQMIEIKLEEHNQYLFEQLCSPDFLNSKNYNLDMELLKMAKQPRYALRIISDKNFIQSPYHIEDLKKILDAGEDSLLARALAEISKNKLSLQSSYHSADMDLIIKYGAKYLQGVHSFPEHSLNNLAINPVSLKDKYHLENMQILAENYSKSYYLYRLMTDKAIVQGRNYREEIMALASSKSPLKTRAIFYYIKNPNRTKEKVTFFTSCDQELEQSGIDFFQISLLKHSEETIQGKYNPMYLKYLELLNKVKDKYVLYIEELLANLSLNQSGYLNQDIEKILSIKEDDIFFDLYKIMSNMESVNSKYHLFDVNKVSQEKDNQKRKWLVLLATSKENIESPNHLKDMKFISSLDFSKIDKEKVEVMEYFFLNSTGINNPSRYTKLNELMPDEFLEENTLKEPAKKQRKLLKKEQN